jgi:signal peptidase I
MKNWRRNLLIVVGVVLIVCLSVNLVIERAVVNGGSMLPGLADDQRIIILTAAYDFTAPQRGDVIIIHPPVAPDKLWIKRLIGLPGDSISIQGGRVYLNSVALDEPYIKNKPLYSFGPYTIPADHYFVLGDNRNNSTDSHYGWTVTRENIVGKAWLCYWPFNQVGIVQAYDITGELADAGQTGLPVAKNRAFSALNDQYAGN